MTTPQGMLELADSYLANNAAESGADEIIRGLSEALRRQAAAPKGREADWPPKFELMKLQARRSPAGNWIDIFPVQLEWTAKMDYDVRALTPAVAPDAPQAQDKLAGIDFEAVAQRAKCAADNVIADARVDHLTKLIPMGQTAVAPDGAGKAMQERIAKLSEVLARFHRNACYPDAMPHELYQAATEIAALAQAQKPGEDKR